MQTQLGFGFRSIGRGLKKGVKGAVKYTVVAPTKFAIKSNIAIAKLSAQLAFLPLKYLKKAIVTLGRVLCRAPQVLLEQIASANGIDPAFVPAFCKLVALNSWSLGSIRKYLPTALKLALKLGAQGVFPPIVPALIIVKRIPFVGRFAGADAGFDRPGLQQPAVRASMRTLQLYALSDHLGLMDGDDAAALGLRDVDRVTLQGVLHNDIAAFNGADTSENAALGLAATAACIGAALF